MQKHLKFVKPENYSGYSISQCSKIPALKRHHYFILDQPVTGDAPKNFIKLYEYGTGRIDNPKSWNSYIAKTGQKWYPNESITEHLLNRLGKCIGINMAESALRVAGGQVRFLSKYFLSKDQQLIHGAEMYYGYFENDHAFINEIEYRDESRNLLSIQLTKKAIHTFFPEQSERIFHELIKMLLFDAWVGNNDRHFYNWGIIRHVSGKHEPYFSPVYDTARGLFWNYSEEKIVALSNDWKRLNQRIQKYSNESRPKIGWEGEQDINHFQLVKRIAETEFGISKSQILELFSTEKLKMCHKIIESEFKSLLSWHRIIAIKQLLNNRHNQMIEIVTS